MVYYTLSKRVSCMNESVRRKPWKTPPKMVKLDKNQHLTPKSPTKTNSITSEVITVMELSSCNMLKMFKFIHRVWEGTSLIKEIGRLMRRCDRKCWEDVASQRLYKAVHVAAGEKLCLIQKENAVVVFYRSEMGQCLTCKRSSERCFEKTNYCAEK